ncbi:MAG: hypothetical protein LT070_01135, partial [Solirubrobacteraceae bacterium]|nr:hypothetical protein [Solirubrobacteraceae bacterium]
MNGWTFVYLMLVLKIPIVALLWLVWWAVHQTPDEEAGGDGGEGRDRPVEVPFEVVDQGDLQCRAARADEEDRLL